MSKNYIETLEIRAFSDCENSSHKEKSQQSSLLTTCSLKERNYNGESGEQIEYVTMKCKKLRNEVVIILINKSNWRRIQKDNPDKVLYFPEEIEKLKEFQDDAKTLRMIHQVKKEFRGWIIPADSNVLKKEILQRFDPKKVEKTETQQTMLLK